MFESSVIVAYESLSCHGQHSIKNEALLHVNIFYVIYLIQVSTK